MDRIQWRLGLLPVVWLATVATGGDAVEESRQSDASAKQTAADPVEPTRGESLDSPDIKPAPSKRRAEQEMPGGDPPPDAEVPVRRSVDKKPGKMPGEDPP